MTDVLSFFDEQTFVNDKRIELTDESFNHFQLKCSGDTFHPINKPVLK